MVKQNCNKMEKLIKEVENCSRPQFKILREDLEDKYWLHIISGKLNYSKKHYEKLKYYSKWFAFVFKLFSVYKLNRRICMPGTRVKLEKNRVLRWYLHNQHLFLSTTNYRYLLKYCTKLQNVNRLDRPSILLNRVDYKYLMLIYNITSRDMPSECLDIIISYFGDGFSRMNMYIGEQLPISQVHNGCNAHYYDYFIEYILKVNYFNINV